MSLTYGGVEPQPNLAWQFENSNFDSIANLAPSAQVSPGPGQLLGSAALVTNAPTSNTALYCTGPYATGTNFMNLGTSSPAKFNYNSSNLFCEFWWYTSNTNSGNLNTPISLSDPNSTAASFRTQIRLNDGFGVNFSTAVSNSTPLSSGTWYHFAFSIDSTNLNMYAFVNGYGGAAVPYTGTLTYNSAHSIQVGYSNALSSGYYYDQYIRDLRVFQGGIVPTIGPFTPVAAPFSMNAFPTYITGTSTIAATLLGQFITYVPGKYNTGIRIANKPGTNPANYLRYPTTVNSTTGFTVSWWFKLDSYLTATNQNAIILSVDGGYGNIQILVSGSTTVYWPVTTGCVVTVYNFQSFAANQWINLCLTYVGTTMVLYRDGVSFAIGYTTLTPTNFATNGLTPSTITVTVPTAATLQVGLTAIISATGGTFTGALAGPYVIMAVSSGSFTYVASNRVTITAQPTSKAVRIDNYVAFNVALTTINVGGVSNDAMCGVVDDLRVYNTALSAAQVQSVFSMQGAPIGSSGVMPSPKYAWDFENSNVDYVSNLSPSTSVGPPTYTAGKYRQAVLFTNSAGGDPASQRLQYPVSLSSSVGFTVSCWVYFNTYNVGFQTPFALLDANSVTLNCYGSSVLYMYWGRSPDTIQASSSFTYSTGIWYHVAVCYSASQIITFYINGTGTVGLNYGVSPAIPGAGPDTTFSTLYVGSSGTGGAFNGLVDDLRIYDRALTSIQVNSVYNQQGVPGRGAMTINSYIENGLVAYYDTQNLRYPDSVSGTTWSDISGNGRSVTIRSGSSYNSAGKYITFDGTVNSGTTVAESGQSLARWTVMCAFMQTANGTSFARIAGASPNIDAGEIGLYGQTLSFNPPEAGSWTYTSFTTTYNVWYHMCMAFDTTTTGVVDAWVYINGALVDSYTIDGTVENLTGYVIGNRVDFNGEAMIGRMSLFAIYNRVLSQSEVSENYEFYKKTQIPTYLPIQLTGTPLFTQLSPSAKSSAVGAFSLRAVNGTSAKAVRITKGSIGTFPPTALSTTAMTGQVVDGVTYTVSSSSTQAGPPVPNGWQAFNKTGGTSSFWQAQFTPVVYTNGVTPAGYIGTKSLGGYPGEWLKLQLSVSICLTSYTLQSRSDFIIDPNSWVILGSNDGTNWTMVDKRTGIVFALNETKTFNTASSLTFLYFAIVISVTNGIYGSTCISEWTLFNSSKPTDFYADRLGNLLTAPISGQPLVDWLGGATGYVTTWYDQSGAENHVSQATTASQPSITTNGTIVFSGAQSFSNSATTGGCLAASAGTKTKYSYGAVWNPSSLIGYQSICEHNASTPTNSKRSSLLLNTTTLGFNGQNNDIQSLIAGLVTGTQYSTIARIDNTDAGYDANGNKNVRMRQNGADYAGVTDGGYATLNLDNYQFVIGKKATSAAEYFSGSMKSIMVFKDVLSDADTALLHAWQQSI